MNLIKKYFPDLSAETISRFRTMAEAFKDWNEKINVVSRKDIDNIETNHILHSLAIAKFIKFKPESVIIDLGTGGGFPALPLALIFPESHFLLVDRIGKKLKVAEEIAKSSEINNVSFLHGDFSECKTKCDFVVSRAVMPQEDLVKAARKNISRENFNALPNGLISLKGGDLTAEIRKVKEPTEIIPLSNYFDEQFFETKKLVYTVLS